MTQSSEPVIRAAVAADVREIERIALSNCKNPWNLEQILGEIGACHASLYCAITAGHIVGFIDMHIVADDAHINEIAVDSAYRGAGLGRALLKECVDEAARRGCKELSLEVRKGANAARRLYESSGFCEAGVRKGFYSDPEDDAVVMVLNLITDADGKRE